MLRRSFPVAVLAIVAVVAALAVSACSSGSVATSTGTTEPTTAPTETTVLAPDAVPVWFIKDGKVTPSAPRTINPADPVRGQLDALMAGPTPEEAAAGLSTGIASGIVEVQSFDVGADGIATVSFSRKFETADTRPQTAQVVYTLTELPQVTKVRFLIDGQPNGATGVPPVGRADLRFPAATG
jgi:spore germination protein GerM